MSSLKLPTITQYSDTKRKPSSNIPIDMAYCIKCRKPQKIGNAVRVQSQNKKQMLRGNCQVCNAVMNRFLTRENIAELSK